MADPVRRDALRKKQMVRLRELKGYINSLKMGQPCVDCGNTYSPCAMDFDHVRGVKRFSIGTDSGYHSMKTLHEELDKCELRCAVCHRIKTHGCQS